MSILPNTNHTDNETQSFLEKIPPEPPTIIADLVAAARALHADGKNFLVNRDRDEGERKAKSVVGPWKEWITKQQTDAEAEQLIRLIADSGRRAISVVCGIDNVECLDFERRDLYTAWLAKVVELDPAMADLLKRLYVETTARGYHIVYESEDAPPGSEDLAFDADGKLGIESRGQAAIIIVAPSFHPSGCQYVRQQGSLTDLPRLNAAQIETLKAAARSLDKQPPKPPAPPRAPTPTNISVNDIPMGRRIERFRKCSAVGVDNSIEGNKGSRPLMDFMCTGLRFGLDDAALMAEVSGYNATRADPPWSEKELRHALESAHKYVSNRGEFGCKLVEPTKPRNGNGHARTQHAASRASEPEIEDQTDWIPSDDPSDFGAVVTPPPDAKPSDAEPLIVQQSDPYSAATEIIRRNYTGDDGREILHLGGLDQQFHQFDGDCYHAMADGDIHHKALNTLANAKTRVRIEESPDAEAQDGTKKKVRFDVVPFKPKRSFVGEVTNAMAAQTKCMTQPPCWIGDTTGRPDPTQLLVCKNALVDISGGIPKKICKPTPTLFTLNALPYPFEPDAPTPADLIRFLDQLFPDDPQSIEALQEFAGYLLTPCTFLQKALMLIGPKRSGKGTILRLLAGMLGAENICSPTLASLGSEFGLQPLLGKLAAFISDARLSSRADLATVLENILRITGEDLLSVNRKHKPALPSVRIHARIVVATNETPKLNDSSGAIASRFIILKMEKSFLDAEDTGLSDRLIAGLPGVLNWAIAGRQRLLERGKFIQPSSAADAVQQLADASSAVGVFLRDCAVIGDGKTASVTDAWNAWNWWCEQQGRNHPGDQSYLGRELRTVIPTLTTPQPRGDDGKQHRVFDGFTLTAEAKAAGTEWFERQQLEMEAKKRRNRDTILRY